MSPSLVRRDVRHVGDTEALVAFHGAVDDIDGIAAQHEINQPGRWTLPALDLVLTELIDQIVLLGRRKCRKTFAAAGHASFVDAADRGAIEVDEGRPDVDDAGFEQRLTWRDRNLLIDEMRDAGLARARQQ